ncbi:hypothetical protein NG799_28560 [Laspinema sp. D1]|uniref:Uncharacterized protein n=1 Tax=Laspinema palackyanum D2a TaxID=2953684 RepID=A0ABT2MZW6_9CYAN|nr:hypothetical protein [Laspinema sp. D2a]
MQGNDSWGYPQESPQDSNGNTPPTRYPQGHTDTLGPALNQAITNQRVPKIPALKGWGKSAVIAGSVLGALWIFSVLGSLSSRDSISTPQAIELAPMTTEAIEPEPMEPPSLTDLTSRRSQAWEQVRQSCGLNLQSIAGETDSEVRAARADSWLLYAKQQCDADPKCGSPYDWLRMQLDERGARIQRIALADRLPVRAKEIVEYRQAQSDLLDIAKALSSGVSARSLSWVPADQLSDAIDDCSSAAKRFESLTRAAVEDAQMFPEGGLGDVPE